MANHPDPEPPSPPSHWLWVLALIGLDYFSTLAYHPSLAFQTAGRLAPLATLVVVAVTLFAALPVYLYIAGRSFDGQGAAGLLERTVPGWGGKLLTLTLLGFAATDFIITRSISTADAAEHLLHNPLPAWQRALAWFGELDDRAKESWPHPAWESVVNFWNNQLLVTILLSVLGFTFWNVFSRGLTRRVVQIAVGVVLGYLALTGLVVGCGVAHLVEHPEVLSGWYDAVLRGDWQIRHGAYPAGGWERALALSLFFFPKMALGLSGFELSMVVMPLVRGRPKDTAADPRGRVRNTRKMLVAAALVMSVYLLGTTLVTSLLITPEALHTDGQAGNRALAYLAHGGGAVPLCPLFGIYFGTLYDLLTLVILGLAGTSVALGLRDLVPKYLFRLGMEFEWAHQTGAVLHLLNLVNLLVTVGFQASVTAQRDAYATSVLALLASAGVAATLNLRRGNWLARLLAPYYGVITVGLLAAGLCSLWPRADGLRIALWFILVIVLTSLVSRVFRNKELRFRGFQFGDSESKFLWESLRAMDFPVLVPHRPGKHPLAEKEVAIRTRHRLPPEVPVVFVEAELGDASDFYQSPLLRVVQEEGRFILRIAGCVSVAHVLAAASLELSAHSKPPEIHFGWSEESPVLATVNFVLFGQGNIPWLVHDLIRRAEPDPAKRPRIYIG